MNRAARSISRPRRYVHRLACRCACPRTRGAAAGAHLLRLSRRRLHELVHGQRDMSPDTAIRCARVVSVEAASGSRSRPPGTASAPRSDCAPPLSPLFL